ncbi:MAG: hypothetical protein JWL83_1450 [Actinomycetia bacterium]|nr:hypothetical protein [Actinomycetes bacterium]
MPSAPGADARRVVARASTVGAVAAGLVFLWFVAGPHFDLLSRDTLDNFYDLQARALMHFRWNVPAGSVGFEGFVINGKTYMYFGPVPALLRIPVLAFTHRFDGRLTRISLLVGFAITMAFVVRLAGQVREIVRGDEPVTRGEAWAVGAFTFVIGGGSVLTFLASRAIVYHEALMWATAFGLASTSYLLRWFRDGRGLALAATFATLALLSRPSGGGLAPVVALAVVFAGRLAEPALRRYARVPRVVRGAVHAVTPPQARRASVWGLLAAVAVPVALYAYVNVARFGVLNPPVAQQLYSAVDANRKEVLAKVGGLFSARYVPTTALQFLRPDAFDPSRLFPFVTFRSGSKIIGNVPFDTIDFSSSLTTTMPLLMVLAVVGVVAVARRRRDNTRDLAVLRAPMIGAFAGGAITLTIGFITHRYLADFLPFVALAALVGLYTVIGRAPAWRGVGARRLLAGGLVALGALGTWANFAFALQYQRLYGPSVPNDVRVGYLGFQHDLDHALFGGHPYRFQQAGALPRDTPNQALVALGACASLYWSDSRRWIPVERSARGGAFQFDFRAAVPGSGLQPLVATGTAGDATIMAVATLPDGRLRFEYVRVVPGSGSTTSRVVRQVSAPVRINQGAPVAMDVLFDPLERHASVVIEGNEVFGVLGFVRGGTPTIGSTRFGAGAVRPKFTGELKPVDRPPRLCQRLVQRAR